MNAQNKPLAFEYFKANVAASFPETEGLVQTDEHSMSYNGQEVESDIYSLETEFGTLIVECWRNDLVCDSSWSCDL